MSLPGRMLPEAFSLVEAGREKEHIMRHLLVYSDSLTWGIIPATRNRLDFEERWPGVLEGESQASGCAARVIEDCLNGRRTAWDDPFKPGRNGLAGLAQKIESHSPLSLVIVMLGTNDFQSVHAVSAQDSAQGLAAVIAAVRAAPIEPGMPVPPLLIVAPPPILEPKGPIAAKFAGAAHKSAGAAQAYGRVSQEAGCHFFDAGCVTGASVVDGIHLDADQHRILGKALAQVVRPLLA